MKAAITRSKRTKDENISLVKDTSKPLKLTINPCNKIKKMSVNAITMMLPRCRSVEEL